MTTNTRTKNLKWQKRINPTDVKIDLNTCVLFSMHLHHQHLLTFIIVIIWWCNYYLVSAYINNDNHFHCSHNIKIRIKWDWRFQLENKEDFFLCSGQLFTGFLDWLLKCSLTFSNVSLEITRETTNTFFLTGTTFKIF